MDETTGRGFWGPICDTRIPPHVNATIHKRIFQPAMLYKMETSPMASSHMKKWKGQR